MSYVPINNHVVTQPSGDTSKWARIMEVNAIINGITQNNSVTFTVYSGAGIEKRLYLGDGLYQDEPYLNLIDFNPEVQDIEVVGVVEGYKIGLYVRINRNWTVSLQINHTYNPNLYTFFDQAPFNHNTPTNAVVPIKQLGYTDYEKVMLKGENGWSNLSGFSTFCERENKRVTVTINLSGGTIKGGTKVLSLPFTPKSNLTVPAVFTTSTSSDDTAMAQLKIYDSGSVIINGVTNNTRLCANFTYYTS